MVVEKIANFLVNYFGSKELALAELVKGQIWFWNSDIFRDTVVTFLGGENINRSEDNSMSKKGWWCIDNSSWSVTLKGTTLSIAWLNCETEKEQLFKLLGGYTGITVNIEVTHDFNDSITPNRVLFNAPYGTYGKYFDVMCEVGSPLWVECLWHQVNFTATGFTKEEFVLPSYSWLHKLLPTGLGSNRKDGHSSSSWTSSYSIVKDVDTITLNGDDVYDLQGKFLYSNMEREIEAATPHAPDGVPYLESEFSDYGTTVSLGRWDSKFTATFNALSILSEDLDAISNKYKICDDINWSKRNILIAYPEVLGIHSCVLQEDCDPNNWETETYWWLFPGKTKWIALGEKISLSLIAKLEKKMTK